MPRVFWTDEEEEILKKHYPDNLTEDILHLLPRRTVSAITSHAGSMGVGKSEAFFGSEKSGRTMGQHSESGRFKKGVAGWNKGKKRAEYINDPESLKKIVGKQYKKGNRPHNWKPIGSERVTVDGYIEVKIQDGCGNKNYDLKHRMIYEQNFGEIPIDHIVAFKDGDALNFEPDNLELITRREGMLRSHYADKTVIKRYMRVKDPDLVAEIIDKAPELVELKRKTIQLEHKIKSKDGNKNK